MKKAPTHVAGKTRVSIALCLLLLVIRPAASLAANAPPSISGSPATIGYAEKSYSFRPTGSDPDGNKLAFRISRKPLWATFSGATGTLAGTPSTSQVGIYTNIVISVTDGLATRSLPAFSIKVVPATTAGSPVSLTWLPPTQHVDGTKLTTLAGYTIHYGKVSGKYAYSLPVRSPSITSATIENLEPAIWYFAVKAVTGSGVESEFSREVSKVLL